MNFKTLRGMQDILPDDIIIWQFIEQQAKDIFEIYNFQEIRTPILEMAELFLRSIGEDTDIVEKEMYIFDDKKGRKVALRPEGTASVVRAYIEHSLFNLPSPRKFYYIGPMFRYERPQKGRFRQFHQIGVEVFGVKSPSVEAELLYILKNFFEKLKINRLAFEINSIGCKECRQEYKEKLFSFLNDKISFLCNDCQRRFNKNPLRLLDCKVPTCRETLKDTPLILDYLCEECKAHFENFKEELSFLGIEFVINPKIVRGLDYYTKTVFEVTTTMLGAQNAVAAGGRYDDLVEMFGGPSTPAAGFAIGMERLVELCKQTISIGHKRQLVYVSYAGKGIEGEARKLSNILRGKGINTETAYEELSLKAQLKRADKIGANWVIIVGEEEMKRNKYIWKNMKDSTQGEGSLEDIITLLENSR